MFHACFTLAVQVWYVDGETDQVLARWGPLTIRANGADDPEEETHEATDMPDLDEGRGFKLRCM